jgi:hypothetical protein
MRATERKHYRAAGALGPGPISRRARVVKCPSCKAWVFRGLESDWCAWGATVDVQPLDAMGELVALLGGLSTYSLAFMGGHYEINNRTELHIASRPPGSRVNEDVVTAHRCGVSIASAVVSTLPRGRVAKPTPKNPPF